MNILYRRLSTIAEGRCYMKALILMLVVAAVVIAGWSYAADKVVLAQKDAAITALAQMKLTPEQKVQAEKAIAELDWAGETEANWQTCYVKLETILTATELTQFKAEVAKVTAPPMKMPAAAPAPAK